MTVLLSDRILLSDVINHLLVFFFFFLTVSPVMWYAKDTILRGLPRIDFKNREVIVFNRGDGICHSIEMSQY